MVNANEQRQPASARHGVTRTTSLLSGMGSTVASRTAVSCDCSLRKSSTDTLFDSDFDTRTSREQAPGRMRWIGPSTMANRTVCGRPRQCASPRSMSCANELRLNFAKWWSELRKIPPRGCASLRRIAQVEQSPCRSEPERSSARIARGRAMTDEHWSRAARGLSG